MCMSCVYVVEWNAHKRAAASLSMIMACAGSAELILLLEAPTLEELGLTLNPNP